MFEYFKKILSSNEDASSKRFAALITLLSLIIMTFLGLFKSSTWLVPEYMYDTLAWIVIAGLGLGVVEKFRRYSNRKIENTDNDINTNKKDSSENKEDIP